MYTLDMEEMFSRDEVYKLSWHGDQRADCTKMDAEEIFIPESQYYHVASIIQGNIRKVNVCRLNFEVCIVTECI